MGLDLYLTRVILEQYGGTITVDSRVGEGTRVAIVVEKADIGA
jgi:signal transduction histidine kinase